MKAEKYLKKKEKIFKDYINGKWFDIPNVNMKCALKAVKLARKEEQENKEIGIQMVLDAEKHWILSGDKDLDSPYVLSSGEEITLRDMLNNIDRRNEAAIKQAQGLIELTCDMFIKPSELIDNLKA
jgi:hypothetical protein